MIRRALAVAILSAMRVQFIDTILEETPDRIIACKQVTNADDYLEDHFPQFPVFPGVMMLETMVYAARRLLQRRNPAFARHVLCEVRAMRYGAMVRPGQSLRVEVALLNEPEPCVFNFKGVGEVHGSSGEMARVSVSGRFTLRPVRA